MTLDLDKKGFFGGRSEQRTEFRRDQFTMDGVRNLGGETTETQGKSAKDVECLIADAGLDHKVQWQVVLSPLVLLLLPSLASLTLDG